MNAELLGDNYSFPKFAKEGRYQLVNAVNVSVSCVMLLPCVMSILRKRELFI